MFFILDIINYFNIGLMGPGKKKKSSKFYILVSDVNEICTHCLYFSFGIKTNMLLQIAVIALIKNAFAELYTCLAPEML